MINFFKKHWEVLSYLVFGVLCTLLNIVLYALFNKLFGYTAANSWGNVLDNIICILFAYCTNRAFVFRSKTQGKAMAREFGAFVTCRLGTMLLDTAIMLVLGNLLAAQFFTYLIFFFFILHEDCDFPHIFLHIFYPLSYFLNLFYFLPIHIIYIYDIRVKGLFTHMSLLIGG